MKRKLYLLFVAILIFKFIYAQSPGGVSTNLKLWLKSTSGIHPTGVLVDSWDYANDISKSFIGTNTERPQLTPSAINFNPVVSFNNSLMDGPNGSLAPIAAGKDDYSLFAVWKSNADGFQRVWNQRLAGTPPDLANGFSLFIWDFPSGPSLYGNQSEKNPYDQGVNLPVVINKWNITEINLLDQLTNDVELRDQSNVTGLPLFSHTTSPGGPTGAGLRNLSDQSNRLGCRDNAFEEAFNGDLAELIVYDASVANSTTRNQIFSYLALKYGILKTGNYVASDGTTIYWDSTANFPYNFSVFGLGLDVDSELDIQQSNSSETGSGNGMGQTGKANIVLFNPSNFSSDKQFLMLGNDNGAATEQTGSTDLPTSAASSFRLGREWKVQSTNNPGTVALSIDLNGIPVTGLASGDFRLMVDEDGDGDFTTGTVRFYIPAAFISNIVGFTDVTLNSGEVFTLITSASAALPVKWKSFTAGLIPGGVSLNWIVDNNEDAKIYEIEHSADGRNFSKSAEVLNKRAVQSYKFNYPTAAAGIHYFRIRQVDLDGKAYYSKVISVLLKGNSLYTIRILSNPVRNNYAEFEITAGKAGRASIELWSSAGTKLSSQQQAIGQGINKVRIPMDRAASGNYIIKLQVGDVVVIETVMKF